MKLVELCLLEHFSIFYLYEYLYHQKHESPTETPGCATSILCIILKLKNRNNCNMHTPAIHDTCDE